MATLYDDNDLKNIIMECPNEDISYKDPIVMTRLGKALYAYVTLVMLGDRYIPAAIVLAHSIKKLGSLADTVVLVTPDVTQEGRELLQLYFTHVISITYVDIPNWRTKKQKHKKYLELVFTKFHVFNLVQYEKILLIDADALVLKYPDHLFSLDAPAGCFLEDKNLIITYDADGNYILPKNGQFEWYKKYCGEIQHGTIIPKHFTDRIRTERNNSGIGGGLMLLKPRAGEFEAIIKDVTTPTSMKILVERQFVWPEQQYLTLRYSGKWTSINPRFFGLQGYPHWKVLYGLQYGGDKPFMMDSKFDINIRAQYPDYILWHEYYKEILSQHPTLKTSTVLIEANEVHKHFHTSINKQSRMLKRIGESVNDKPTVEIISKLFRVGKHEIHETQLSSYHINRDSGYRSLQLDIMFDNIGAYDYFTPLNKLSEYYTNDSYYSTILKLYEDIITSHVLTNNNRLDTNNRISPIDKDLIMLEYIKCRKNAFVVTVWPLITKHCNVEDIAEMLKSYGNVYYVKSITLTKNGLFNLMFALYDEFTYKNRLDFITKKLEYIGVTDATNEYTITMFVFDNVNNVNISGQGSKIKNEIRTKLVNLLSDKIGVINIRGNDLIHINDFFYQTVEYAQMMLNKNSLDFLEKQDITTYCDSFMTESHLKFNSFKKWTMLNMSLLEQTRLIMIGGIILYMYGVRKSNDIDGFYISVGQNNSTSEKVTAKLLYDNFINTETKFFFADVGAEGSEYWKDSWTHKNNEIFEVVGVSNSVDLTTNPHHYFYYQGIKFYLIKYEIIRKMKRNRAQDHADFLMMASQKKDLITQYVQLDVKLDLKYIFDCGMEAPQISTSYMKHLLSMIYKRYTRKNITSFLNKYKND
jgi:hypothetical protein